MKKAVIRCWAVGLLGFSFDLLGHLLGDLLGYIGGLLGSGGLLGELDGWGAGRWGDLDG